MPKTVFKGFKAIKLPHSGRKKVEQDHEAKDETKKKKMFKGLKKLIPAAIGNITSLHSRQHHHKIESSDEYATSLMDNLEQLRQEGKYCEMTFSDKDAYPAHKIVVSCNQILFDMAMSLVETEPEFTNEDKDETEEEPEQTIPAENQCEGKDNIKDANSVTDVKSTSTSDEVIGNSEIKSDDCTGLISQLQTHDVVLQIDQQQEESESNSNDQEESKDTQDELIDETNENEKSVAIEVGKDHNGDDIAPPLAAELSISITEENTTEKAKQDETDSINPCEEANPVPSVLTNPIEILINFLYTSHIDITQKNVSALRVLATQCAMEDVITACNEFDKVLHVETECLTTNEEKDAVAVQFRYRYSDPALPSKMLLHFQKLRQENKYTDLIVSTPSNKVSIKVHSIMLVMASSFFRTKLSTLEDQQELKVTEIEEGLLESIIDFLYSGKIDVTAQSVSRLMQACDLLQLSDIIEGCAEFLELTLNINNCFQHRSLAIQHECEGLKDVVLNFIVKNFLQASLTADFVALSIDGLIEIATANRLQLESPIADGELAVFNAVKRWILHDEENRKQHVTKVMSVVRFPLIRQKHLIENIATDLLVIENQEMCDLINSIISSKEKMFFDQYTTMRGSNYLLTIGGSYPIEEETSEERGYQEVEYSNHCTLYDINSGNCVEVTAMPETRALHCVLSCDHFVFVVGGFDSYSCIVNTVYCFDLSDKTWHTMPSLKTKRSCFSLHHIGGYLFAVGGLTPSGYTGTVERLDRSKKRWEMAKAMPNTLYRHAGCVLNGEILVSGGNEMQDSVFSYNPDVNSWKKCHPMNCGRHSHVMEVVDHKAYVIGGEGIHFSAESYDGSTWTMLVQPMAWPPKLYLPGVAVANGKIFLFGGWENENEVLRRVRYYDTKTCLWHNTCHMMPIPRGSAASCSIIFRVRHTESNKLSSALHRFL